LLLVALGLAKRGVLVRLETALLDRVAVRLLVELQAEAALLRHAVDLDVDGLLHRILLALGMALHALGEDLLLGGSTLAVETVVDGLHDCSLANPDLVGLVLRLLAALGLAGALRLRRGHLLLLGGLLRDALRDLVLQGLLLLELVLLHTLVLTVREGG